MEAGEISTEADTNDELGQQHHVRPEAEDTDKTVRMIDTVFAELEIQIARMHHTKAEMETDMAEMEAGEISTEADTNDELGQQHHVRPERKRYDYPLSSFQEVQTFAEVVVEHITPHPGRRITTELTEMLALLAKLKVWQAHADRAKAEMEVAAKRERLKQEVAEVTHKRHGKLT